MPGMDGGDQLSETYAPWFHEKLRKQAAEEKARDTGEIQTVTIEVTWKSSHRIDVPEGMFPEMFAQQIRDDMPQEVAEQFTSATAEMTDWEITA